MAKTDPDAPRHKQFSTFIVELPNPGYAVFVVMTKDMEARERVRSRLMASVDEEFPHAWVRITRLELGPPVGFPVQFRVVGPDTQKVREIAREVQAVMASSPKLRDVQFDWNDPVRALRVDIDQDKARALGLAPADIGFVTQTVMQGATMSQLREHEDLVDIVARAVPSERLDIDTLKAGAHTIVVTAVDGLGNKSSTTLTFTVHATIAGLINAVNDGAAKGLITATEKTNLLWYLQKAQGSAAPRTFLSQFVWEANNQSGKAINAAYAALLVNWGNDLIARTP